MKDRLGLHSQIENAINDSSVKVYFQQPSETKLSYPCVRYELSNNEPAYADNMKFIKHRRYTVMIIDKNPDSVYCERIDAMPYTSFDRTYRADGLYHYVYTTYY